jgi:molybdopterin converting factor small subunit
MTVEVDVRLFGAFRKYEPQAFTLVVPRGTPVRTLRRRLADALRERCPSFADEALLDVSVVADAERILDDGDRLDAGCARLALAILPPVCGG